MKANDGRRHGRFESFLLAVCAVACTSLFASGVLAVATVEVATTNGAPGGTVTLTMSMSRQAGDPAFAGAQIDMIIDRSQLGVEGQCSQSGSDCDSGLDCEDTDACVLLSCELDPRLPGILQLVANSPRFQNVAAGKKRIRIGVTGPAVPVTTFEDGPILTCELDVPASAALGIQELSTDRLSVSDANGDVITSQAVVIPGRIVDPSELTPTATPVQPTATPTNTAPTNTPVIGTPTLTATNRPNTPVHTPTSTPVTPGGGTATPTSTIGNGTTPTPTHTVDLTPAASPTSTAVSRSKKGDDDDGCAIAPIEQADGIGGGACWLALLPGLMVWMRRRR